MFVTGEGRPAASFAVAWERLADLASDGGLADASRQAYDDPGAVLARVGPAGLSRLVAVEFGEMRAQGGMAVLALRWNAAGTASGLFPALDADLLLIPAGERECVLRLAGVYRPPLGAAGAVLDRVMLHRVATATVRSFLGTLAGALAWPAAGISPEPGRLPGWLACPDPDPEPR